MGMWAVDMREQSNNQRGSFLGGCMLAGLFIWLALSSGPLVVAGKIQVWPTIFWGLALLSGAQVLQQLFEWAAYAVDWFGARTPTGKSGTAQWAKKKDLDDA